MEILVTGISGYIGSRLAPRLLRDGHSVRGFARDPDRVALDVPVAAGDAVSGDGLEEALDGIDVAYYLIHSMEGAGNGTFTASERTAGVCPGTVGGANPPRSARGTSACAGPIASAAGAQPEPSTTAASCRS